MDLIEQHTAILEMGVAIWNQWRASEPLTVPNLQNADLSGLELENANLSRANLRGAILDNAYLYDADFQEADLRGASLNRSVLIGANFCKANLSAATLAHAYLAQSDLSQTNLTAACLTEADLQAAIMADAILVDAHIATADMTESSGLTHAQIRSAKDGHLAFLRADLQFPSQATDVALPQRSQPHESERPASPEVIPSKRATEAIPPWKPAFQGLAV